MTDDERLLFVQTWQRHEDIADAHQPGRFNGDALLFAAMEGKREGAPTAELWDGYVSGAITEIRLPCPHSSMVRPDILPQIWSGISRYLGLEESD